MVARINLVPVQNGVSGLLRWIFSKRKFLRPSVTLPIQGRAAYQT